MKILLILLLGFAFGAGTIWLWQHHPADEGKLQANPAGEPAPNLSEKDLAAAGIEIGTPTKARVPHDVKGYGRILDPTPFVAAKLELNAAAAALDASTKEFDRIKHLFGQNQNASARALETAEVMLKRDSAAFAAAQLKLRTTVGPGLATRNDLSAIMEELGLLRWMLARVDVVGGTLANPPPSFQVTALAHDGPAFQAEMLGAAPAVDTSLQGQGYFGLIRTNSLPIDLAIIAMFEDQPEEEGLMIPAAAVVQDGGDLVVFVENGLRNFQKITVEGKPSFNGNLLITKGLSPTNRVVVRGAYQLLSLGKPEQRSE